MNSATFVMKNTGPKLVPFFKTLAIYFVIFPSSDNPTIFGGVLKCLPIVSLMLFVLLHGMSLEEKYKYSRRILTGLIFCCVGDAFLLWPAYFLAGVAAFAIGHINYILAIGFKPFNVPIGVGVLALDVVGILYLLPGIKGAILSVGVPVYVLLLGVMLWRALAQLSFKDRNWNRVCLSVGAVLFVISDLILGINMFKFKMEYGQALVMSFYYAAQLGIALSVVDSTQTLTVKNKSG